MTATFVGPMVPRHASGDTAARVAWLRGATTPGTLWERVAESSVGRDSELYWATLRTVRPRFTPEEFGMTDELARAKAAHPAGKGITHEEVQHD